MPTLTIGFIISIIILSVVASIFLGKSILNTKTANTTSQPKPYKTTKIISTTTTIEARTTSIQYTQTTSAITECTNPSISKQCIDNQRYQISIYCNSNLMSTSSYWCPAGQKCQNGDCIISLTTTTTTASAVDQTSNLISDELNRAIANITINDILKAINS